MSFNCKNMKTSVDTINKLLQKNHIVLIQEHWLFQCQIYKIGEIDSNICYAAKGVDINNPIQPTQLPRGYGGGGCIME